MTRPEPLLLEFEHILDSHQLMITQYGGTPGILNAGLLESVIGGTQTASASLLMLEGQRACPL